MSERLALTQVAANAGLSYQAVSRVVNHKVEVVPDTRAKVLGALEPLAYCPRLRGRARCAQRSTAIAVDALRRMSDYARHKNMRLVFEATNRLEMCKFVNTVLNHRLIIDLIAYDNLGIQIDWFHVNKERRWCLATLDSAL